MNKALIALTICISSALLVSFQAKPKIQKIGEDLYQVNSSSGISAADMKVIKATITKYYGIKDFSKEQTLTMISSNGQLKTAKGGCNWICSTKGVLNQVEGQWIRYTCPTAAALAPDENNLNKVFAKYAITPIVSPKGATDEDTRTMIKK